MQPRVTAILVARDGAQYLERTLSGLARQLRRPDSLVVVDDGSSDASSEMLARIGPTQLVRLDASRPFGPAIAHAIRVAVPEPSDEEWLWLLAHDNAPDANALAALVAAVEIAPSVAVAGPKLMRWDDPTTIAHYGESLTRLGATVMLVTDELDQAQHDRQSDLLAVGSGGMLVRRSVFSELGGFDPALPTVDAALDFCVRVRLAGHRIVGVPAARVASDGGPEGFGRRSGERPTARTVRSAQLHRRMSYARGVLLPVLWLSMLPLAVVRSIWHLLRKRPGVIAGEFGAALAALVDGRVAASRRNIARHRRLGWGAIAPLRMPWPEVRELRAHQRDLRSAPVYDRSARVRPSFLSNGGAWIVLLLVGIGFFAFNTLVGADALSGGGLAPLSDSVSALWHNVGYGWREIGAGFAGAADPFAAVLAVLGSLTFWAPSASIVALYLAALPLAGLAAWWCAARFSERGWAPALAAVLWALAPPFLSSLTTGHLGAVLAHLLLPWLVLAFVGASSSWSSSAIASILFAAIAASSPVLLPFLLVAWLAWLVAHPRRAHRIMGIPIPAILLFAPLIVTQAARGNWLGLLADPGVPFVSGTTSGWHLALGMPSDGALGWASIASAAGLPDAAGTALVAILLVPIAILALLALYLPGSRRSVPALAVALVGFVIAVASAHLSVSTLGSATPTIWPGSGLTVYWLGLVGAAAFTLVELRRRAAAPTIITTVAALVLAGPMLVSVTAGAAAIEAGNGQTLPAFVTAEAASDPHVGTLFVSPQPDGGIATRLVRGDGSTLDEQSTLDATDTSSDAAEREIGTLAANLASRSGYDAAPAMKRLHVGFIIVPGTATDATDAAVVTTARATEALDANSALAPVGSTAEGFLWNVREPGAAVPRSTLTTAQAALATTVRIGLAVVFVVVTLLAIPTSFRRRSRTVAHDDVQAPTFDEDPDD